MGFIYNPPTPQSIGAVPLSDIMSGTYMPVITNVQNLSGNTPLELQYFRYLNNVFVCGQIGLNPTTQPASTRFRLSLPIPSDFVGNNNGGGSLSNSNSTQDGRIFTSAANNEMDCIFNATVTGNNTYSLIFGYIII